MNMGIDIGTSSGKGSRYLPQLQLMQYWIRVVRKIVFILHPIVHETFRTTR